MYSPSIRRSRRFRITALGAAVAFPMARALACPSCYGAANGPMVDGMNTAILVMLGIVGMVFAGIIAFIFWMRHRIRVMPDGTPGAAYRNEFGLLQWKNS
jgi:heme/copper-type cytochrome/quinol oxidase subunit 2